MIKKTAKVSVIPILSLFLLLALPTLGEQIPVRFTEGLLHGFLVLRTPDGKLLADGELTQVAQPDHVTTHLVFRFKDGSIYDDTTLFSQRGSFRLLNDHLIEKGPSFKHPMETTVDASTGQFTVHYTDDKGQPKTTTQKLDLPADVSNGMLTTVITQIQATGNPLSISLVAATPDPRIVKLEITTAGKQSLTHGTLKLNAVEYVVKVKIGGVSGVVAPLVGKQPPDTHVWILAGDAPAFLKMEGPLYDEGPIWRIELATPLSSN